MPPLSHHLNSEHENTAMNVEKDIKIQPKENRML